MSVHPFGVEASRGILRASGHELRITDPTPIVRRVLVLGGVSEHLGPSHLTAVD